MSEEKMVNNVVEETEEMDVYEITEMESDGRIVKTLVKAGLVAAGGVITAVVIKNRNKLEDWRIKRLEKKGYVVYKPEELHAVDEPEENDEITK